MRPSLRRAALILVTGAVAASLALFELGGRLTRPVPERIGPAPADLRSESISFTSRSGSTIRGWLTRGSPGGGVVLLLPGVRANRLAMTPRARLLASEGFATLAIDLQATGESSGEAITFGWRERYDVVAAIETLQRILPSERIGIIGTSLGGAAAILAAPDLHVHAVVLEAVYPALDAAIENRLRMRLGPAGGMLAPLLLWQVKPRLGVSPAALRPIDRIGALRAPVFILSGADDRHTTMEDTRRLYAAAPDPKELWIVPGAAHVDLLHAAGDEYRRRIVAFLDPTLRAPAQ